MVMTKEELIELAQVGMDIHSPDAPEYIVCEALIKALSKPEHWEKFCDSNCVWTDHHPDCKLAEQEPVATLWQHGETGRTRITMPNDITDCDARWFKAADLYTTPPQRTWVGLTQEELSEIYNRTEWDTVNGWEYEQAIEAKLKEKNT